jgi:PPOX class probable F420-dependent enzyme
MDIATAQEFLRDHHRAVMSTVRTDGRPQLSPVLCGLDEAGLVVISSTEDRAKVKNLRRDPRIGLCVFTDQFFDRWVQVEGVATVVSLPEAEELLVDYYRRLSGEHPDWDAYRAAMRDERRVIVRFGIERASGFGE